jgi:ribosome-associated protein
MLMFPFPFFAGWFVRLFVVMIYCSEVRERLKQQQANRINKEGYLALQVQEYRTQVQNRKAAIAKLAEFLKEAWPRPKLRKQRVGPSKASKERNKEEKQKRSETKARRQKVDY